MVANVQTNFTIPTERTHYEDTCIPASELPDLDEVPCTVVCLRHIWAMYEVCCRATRRLWCISSFISLFSHVYCTYAPHTHREVVRRLIGASGIRDGWPFSVADLIPATATFSPNKSNAFAIWLCTVVRTRQDRMVWDLRLTPSAATKACSRRMVSNQDDTGRARS